MLLPLALLSGVVTQRIICPIPEVNTVHVLASWGLLDSALLFILVRTKSSIVDVVSSFLGANAVYFSSLILMAAIHRLYFHPLRHLPGHKVAALTKLHQAYLNANGQLSINVKALHKQYGPVIRTGPNEVSLTSLAALRLLIPTPNHQHRGPMNELGNLFGDKLGNVLTTRDNEYHKLWRPVWEKAFTRGCVTEYEVRVEKHVAQFVRVLRELNGSETDAVDKIGDMTFDVMCDLGFGIDEGLQSGGGNRTYITFMRKFVRTAAILGSIRNLIQLLPYIPQDQTMKDFAALTDELIAKRRAMGDGRRDVFTHIAGGPFSPAQLAANAMLLVVAGSDTTSSVLANTMRELAMHPEWQGKVLREVREHPGIIDVQATKSMPVVCAVVDETLRLWNALPSGIETVVPPGGITVDGIYLPAYTVARGHHLSIMTDPQYFPRGEEWLPNRWLEDREKLVLEPKAFIPFSYGPHMCVGKQVALNELRLSVARVVAEFTLELGEHYSEEKFRKQWRDYFTVTLGNVEMRFRPRE